VWLGRLWPFRTRQGPSISREESFASLPVRNEALPTRRTDAGEIEITIPRREALWVGLLARVFYVPKSRKIVLDELGTFVWERCDGQTTVRDLIGIFAERYKLGRREAEVSLTEYLRTLAKRGLIGIAVPRDLGKRRRRRC
jgi:hypothetical protein